MATGSTGGSASQAMTEYPMAAEWRKVMMWIFIITDGLLFAGFLASYGYLRAMSSSWPEQGDVFSLGLIAFMTFVLITSSATMATAVGAAKNGELTTATRFILATIAGGVLFLGIQAYEWTHLIEAGARLWSNPWGDALFSASFFLITGFHGSHVVTGVIVLAITALRSTRGRATSEGIELAGLYWHFVDLVWVFIFTCFYLL